MQDKSLINELKKLNEIKPNKDWVLLTKKQILGEDTVNSYGFSFFPYLKPAFAGLMVFMVLFGVTGLAKNSLPGDPLYIVKRAYHKAQVVFVSNGEKTGFQLELANNTLESLSNTPAKNFVPTIYEFKANISDAARSLSQLDISTSTQSVIKKIATQAKKLEDNKQKIESLGVIIGVQETDQLNSAIFRIIKSLIGDMDKRTLNEEQAKTLDEMKQLFIEGKYSEALESYLINQ